MLGNEIHSLKILSNVEIKNLLRSNNFKKTTEDVIYCASFRVEGFFNGIISCYFFIDETKLELAELNYLIPLFIESMNILIGKELSIKAEKGSNNFKLYPPQLYKKYEIENLVLNEYQLELDENTFSIGIDFNIKVAS
jgi:hypothetical protein